MRIVKKIFIFILFFFIGILIAQKHFINKQPLSLLRNIGKDTYEYVDTQNLEVVKVEKSEVSRLQSGKVYVPKHWKYGVNTQSEDYLKGYLPNIRNFKEYWNVHMNILYGSNPFNSNYPIEEILSHFEITSSYYISEGIENDSTFFAWDYNNCKAIYSNLTNSNVFTCFNWVNWIDINIEDKGFVLVECSLDNKKGYCLFEDYTKVYFENKRYGESRCFGETDFLCDYEKYLNNIFIN